MQLARALLVAWLEISAAQRGYYRYANCRPVFRRLKARFEEDRPVMNQVAKNGNHWCEFGAGLYVDESLSNERRKIGWGGASMERPLGRAG